MGSKRRVMVAGHICLDVVPTIDPNANKPLNEVLIPGTLTTVTDVDFAIGGAVYNVGEAIQRLGIQTGLCGMVGCDDFGDIIENNLKKSEADCVLMRNEETMTSFSIVISACGSDRTFLHAPGSNNDFTANHVDYDAAAKVDLFHFGYPPMMRNMFLDDGAELVKMLKKIKALGVTTSLDMAMPDPQAESGKVDWPALLQNVLPYVDIYVPSIEETLYMIDRPRYDAYKLQAAGGDMINVLDIDILGEVADKLHDYGAKVVMLKCGGKGCFISTKQIDERFGRACPKDTKRWSNRQIYEKCFKVERVVSTTGAGDTTIAGFLSSLLSGYSIEDAIRDATAVGALCVRTTDAVSAICSMEDVIKMSQDWQK